MTALDLVQQERKEGGLSRVAEVLYELMEVDGRWKMMVNQEIDIDEI